MNAVCEPIVRVRTRSATDDAPASSRGAGPSRLWEYLPWVCLATLLVAFCPIALVWALRSTGTLTSAPLGVALAIAVSLGASRLGAALWVTRKASGDLMFGELMVWGFIRRLHSERRLAYARDLLGSISAADSSRGGVSPDEQAIALERLSAALEATDPYTHGHSRRVARHSWMIAKRMGLRGEATAQVRTAAALHDVGKIDTPAAVLRKPARLTDAEFEIIKRHPADGAEMVRVLGDDTLTAIVRHHHERLDGTGYPDRLAGEEIPIGARIIAVADTFDAITSARPYRATRAHKEALDILKYEAGTQLDPHVVRAFCELYSGRRPLALWASLTSMPAQLFSWVGGAAAGVASTAQVAAIAAVAAVGTVATAPAHSPVGRPSRAAVSAAVSAPAPSAGGAQGATSATPRAASTGSPSHLVKGARVRMLTRANGTTTASVPVSNTATTSPATTSQPSPGESAAATAGEARGPASSSGSGSQGGSPATPVPVAKVPVAGTPVSSTGSGSGPVNVGKPVSVPVTTVPVPVPIPTPVPVTTIPVGSGSPTAGGSTGGTHPEAPPHPEKPIRPEKPTHPEKPSHAETSATSGQQGQS